LNPTHLGVKALATQHLLGAPYFKSVTDKEIVVEWQQLASHGRRVVGEDFAHPMCKIGEESDHRGYMGQTYTKVDGQWRIAVIRPEVLYAPGEFLKIARPDDAEEKKES
jgi:scytalone dehydratase